MKTFVVAGFLFISMQMIAQELYDFSHESKPGEWQEVTVPFDKMIPTFRGIRLNMPNYPGEILRECSFLISNKKNESFRLEIDKIWLETSAL